MNALPSTRRLVWLLALVVATVSARAEDVPPPNEAQLRAAATRSLGFLAKEGDTWMNEKTCNACHHMPLLLWSHRLAKERGFPIDAKVYDELIDWSNERSKEAKIGMEMQAFLKLATPGRPLPEVTNLIMSMRQPDGSWKPGPQFTSMQRRDANEATGNTVRIILLALGTQEADQAIVKETQVKVAALLNKNDPAKSVETLVFRALYARRFGTGEEFASLRAEMLELQHDDGGWGWVIGEEQSDPLATGEVLYALQQAPETISMEAIARARQWLLNHQREDGGWPIDITRISRMDRSTPEKSKSFKAATDIYTFWGSAWATISLLEGLPVSAKAPAP